MGVVRNTVKDMAGEAQQLAGAATNNDDLEEQGHRKRVEAEEQEVNEQAADGVIDDHQREREKVGKMAVPDFKESDNYSVDEVTPESSK